MFLSEGFDSFGGAPEPMNTGMGQMNAGMGQLGSVDYGNENAYGTVGNSAMSTNRWSEPIIMLNLWGQLFNSFMPFRYDRYKGMSMDAAKDFVKFFVRLYMTVGYLVVAFMLFVSPEVKSRDMSFLLVIILLGISYAIGFFLGPYLFRFRALIYRVIFGNLFMAVEKKNITSTNMYLVSIYACVPCMAVRLLYGVLVLLTACLSIPMAQYMASIKGTISMLQLIVPIIIMAMAIPKME